MSRHIVQSEAVSPSASDPPSTSVAGWLHVAVAAAALMLIGVPLTTAGRMLWIEFEALQEEERAVADSAVIGYPNISPSISNARKPDPWFRVEGETVLVWAGWRENQGHDWFRARLGDFDRRALGDPIGRDVTRAIDDPAVENGDGPIWRRIPGSARVVGLALDGRPCAYPMAVLGKVLIVNDMIQEHPYVVHFDPFHRSTPVSIFDSRLEGRRITLGSSGITIQGKHVLYDRGTQSLWADDGHALTSFAGKHKGKTLSLVARVMEVAWEEWRANNPRARLIVGSLERKSTLPSE